MKPSEIYEDLVSSGELINDSAQKKLLVELDRLHSKVMSRSRSWFKKKPLKGLYIYGTVGTGKTQLMDIFFKSLDLITRPGFTSIDLCKNFMKI